MATDINIEMPSVSSGEEFHDNAFGSDSSDDESEVFSEDSPPDTEQDHKLLSKAQHINVEIRLGSGREMVTYQLPRDLLMEKCPYFQVCLDAGFAESISNKIVMRDVDPKVFRSFVHWLFTSELHSCDREDYYAIWILADGLMCDDLKNLAMNSIQLQDQTETLNLEQIRQICLVLPIDSTLATYCVREAAWELAQGARHRAEDIEALLNTSLTVAEALVALISSYEDTPDVEFTKEWLDPGRNVACFYDGTLESELDTKWTADGPAPHEEEGCSWHDHEDPRAIEKGGCPTPGWIDER